MGYYKTCCYCGANLDPGEHCDCRSENATSAANAGGGKGNQEDTEENAEESDL